VVACRQEIVRTLRLVMSPGQVMELRALEGSNAEIRGPATLHGYFDFDHIEEMASCAESIHAKGIYFLLNPVNPAMQARANNRIKRASKGESTADADITRRKLLFIDCDAVRLSGVSATDAERQDAWNKAQAIMGYLAAQGWPKPILADSGNGWHLLYLIDLPTDDEGLVQRVLEGLAAKFDDEKVIVDRKVFNPARICKLYGTVAAKGDSTAERPHRLSRIHESPTEMTAVSRQLLESVASPVQAAADKKGRKQKNAGPASPASPKTGRSAYDRCLRYLAKCPDAISGDSGHDKTLYAACICYRFGLSDEDARRAMDSFNASKTGGEEWTAAEMQHKLEDAKKKVLDDGTFGKLTAEKSRTHILVPGAHKDDQDNFIEQSNVAFAETVLTGLPPDAIYRRDSIPGEIIGLPGTRKWIAFSPDRTRIVVDGHVRLAKWITGRRTGEQYLLYQPCNRDNAGLFIAHAENAPGIRDLNMIVSCPVYGPGFTRIAPGWHKGLYYDEPEELRGLQPETNYEVIHGVLDDLVVDFPFKTAADKENSFGLLLTPIMAPAIDGNRPMHLLNAPLERTGKTKLVNEVLGGVIAGRDTPAMQITEREEEREKRILAMLLQGETLMHLDNLPAYIDSPALASLLTTKYFIGRVLGCSRNASLPNNLTIVGTGNNVQASGEIAKRIVPIMIEPKDAHPEARTDFKHPDIRAYVRQQRRLVLECLLGMAENWIAAGKPKHENRLGGFENWSETIGGILLVNGFRMWRTNEGDWRSRADSRGAEMLRFVQLWHERFAIGEVAPRGLLELAEKNELFGAILAKQTPQAVAVAFGRMLQRHTDTPVGNWHIRYRNNSGHPVYRLEEIK